MKKSASNLIVLAAIASLLSACGAPAAVPPTDTPLPPTPISVLTKIPPTETAAPSPVSGLSELHMQDADTGWAWASKPDNSYALLRTGDGGLTWSEVTPADLPVAPFGSFFLDASSTWVQFYDPAANTNGLARTTDGGLTWAVVNRELAFSNASLGFSSREVGWAEFEDVGAGNAFVTLYRTMDGGATWEVIPVSGPERELSLPAGTIHLCSICGDSIYYDPARLIITHGDLAAGPGGAVRLSVSTDLGKTWKDLALPLPDSKYSDDMIAPHTPTFFNQMDGLLPVQMTLFNANSSTNSLAVYATHNGGLTWTPAPAVLEDISVFDPVDFVSLQDAFARCGDNLCATHDGARSWQTLQSNLDFSSSNTAEYVFHFYFAGATTGWAITTDGTVSALWKTIDGGTTWTKLAPVFAP